MQFEVITHDHVNKSFPQYSNGIHDNLNIISKKIKKNVLQLKKLKFYYNLTEIWLQVRGTIRGAFGKVT